MVLSSQEVSPLFSFGAAERHGVAAAELHAWICSAAPAEARWTKDPPDDILFTKSQALAATEFPPKTLGMHRLYRMELPASNRKPQDGGHRP